MRTAGDRLDIRVNGSALTSIRRGGDWRTLHGLLAETKDNFISLGACNVDAVTPVGGTDVNSVGNLTITQLPASLLVGAAAQLPPHHEDGREANRRTEVTQ